MRKPGVDGAGLVAKADGRQPFVSVGTVCRIIGVLNGGSIKKKCGERFAVGKVAGEPSPLTFVIASDSEAIQGVEYRRPGLLRRFAPRKDEIWMILRWPHATHQL